MKKRMHFRPSHRDKAERAIITALRSVGASVYQVNGKDIPDLLVGFRGVTTLLEVKSRLLSEEKGRAPRIRTTKVSEGQKEFAATWRGGPSVVVHEPHEALIVLDAPWASHSSFGRRWFAENGAFLCESCWLPENGLHDAKCPTRLALKRPPKVETAHRAAKKAREVLPKSRTGSLSIGAPDKEENVVAFVEADASKPTPEWMAEAVREHNEELRKASSNAEAMAASSQASDEQRRTWAKGVVERQSRGVDDIPEEIRIMGRATVLPRGVEGELQPLPKRCGARFCRKNASAGGVFCEAHEATNLPTATNGA